jgi:hypothetical protein
MEEPLENSQPVSSSLEDGTRIGIETHASKGITKIASDVEHPFEDITKSIESIAHAFKARLKNVKPRKSSIEFGIDIAAEEGRLFAVIVKGEAKANIKVILEWAKEDLEEENVLSEAQETKE